VRRHAAGKPQLLAHLRNGKSGTASFKLSLIHRDLFIEILLAPTTVSIATPLLS
jgi:hypothetical protein